MTDSIGVGGAWKTKVAEYIGVSGTWKQIASEWIGVGGAWKLMFTSSPVSVTATDPTPSGSCQASSGTCFASASSNITASGGIGGYEFSITKISGDTITANLLNIDDDTKQASFSSTKAVGGSADTESVYRVTVTDGLTSDSVDLTVNLSFVQSGV